MKCSVPMWIDGCPAGTCGAEAYGHRPPGKTHRRWDGIEWRDDGRYAGYVPGVACAVHGGPTLADVAHQGDPCKFCGTAQADVEVGPCPALTPNA